MRCVHSFSVTFRRSFCDLLQNHRCETVIGNRAGRVVLFWFFGLWLWFWFFGRGKGQRNVGEEGQCCGGIGGVGG